MTVLAMREVGTIRLASSTERTDSFRRDGMADFKNHRFTDEELNEIAQDDEYQLLFRLLAEIALRLKPIKEA